MRCKDRPEKWALRAISVASKPDVMVCRAMVAGSIAWTPRPLVLYRPRHEGASCTLSRTHGRLDTRHAAGRLGGHQSVDSIQDVAEGIDAPRTRSYPRAALQVIRPTAPDKMRIPPTYSDMQEYGRASARFYAECLDACTFR